MHTVIRAAGQTIEINVGAGGNQTTAGNGGTLTLSSSNSTAWAGYGVEILAA